MSLFTRMVNKLKNSVEPEQIQNNKTLTNTDNTATQAVNSIQMSDVPSHEPTGLAAPDALDDEAKQAFAKLPEQLQKVVLDTFHPFIKLNTQVCQTMRLTDSKFGGVPYIPSNIHYPISADGTPLMLLAQINFAQVFEQVNHTDFIELPKQGLLQIFVNTKDEKLGLTEAQTTNKNYQIRFIPQIDIMADTLPTATMLANQSVNPTIADDLELFTPISTPLKLSFSKEYGCAGVSENLIEFMQANHGQAIDELDYDNDEKEDLAYETLNNLSNAGGHKLLGMPLFPDAEFRKPYSDLRLLLQIDSEYPLTNDYEIMWGDMGVANFFIKPDELVTQKFLPLVYHWQSE